MAQLEQSNNTLILSAEQVKELRAYLIKQPYEVVNPIVIFLSQIEAEQARDREKGQESKPSEPESQSVKEGNDPKPVKKGK